MHDICYSDEFAVCWHVQFFSNLLKHRSAVSNGPLFRKVRKLLWRKILLHGGQQKVCLSEGQPTLVTFHLFLVGATFSELVNLLLTLSNCVLKQRRNILQFIIWSAWLGFLPLWGAGTGLVGILPLPLIFDLPENTTLPMETMHKTLWNYWIQRSPQDSKPSANKSCAILLFNQSLGVSNLQRGWSFE